MPPIDYNALLQQEFEEYAGMLLRRQEADFEIAQKEQFIRATINMLPEDKKTTWQGFFEAMSAGDIGLSDSIRNVLRAAPGKFYTATEVKQMLMKSDFDFSKYTTNPLSSIHAALKRLKPDEAEMNQIEGVMAWRWVKEPSAPSELERQKILAELAKRYGRTVAVPYRDLGRKTPIPLAGSEGAAAAPSNRARIVDLMAALKKNLAELEQKKKVGAERAAAAKAGALRAAADEEDGR